jgi:hypothetical protein
MLMRDSTLVGWQSWRCMLLILEYKKTLWLLSWLIALVLGCLVSSDVQAPHMPETAQTTSNLVQHCARNASQRVH